MNRGFAIAAAGVLLAAGAIAAPAGSGTRRAPESAMARTLQGLDGTEATLAGLQGRVVVVNFWASWCKPCRKDLPVLESWMPELQKSGTEVVAVSVDRDRRRAEKFVEEIGLDLPFYIDGPEGLAQAFDLPALPCTIVLDRNGNVAHVAEGAEAATLDELRRVVNRLAAEPQG
jgi:thiol-disulfide isomerase/thioredoxin